MAQGAVLAKTTTTLAVTGSPGLKGKTLVASALAVLLRDFSGKEAALLTLEPRPAAGPTGTRPPSLLQLARAPTDAIKGHLADEGLDVPVLHATLSAQDAGDGGAEHLASVTASLGELFPWVVLDIGDGAGAIRAASEVSDILIDVVERPSPSPREGEGPHTRTFEVVNLHNPTSLTSPAIPISHCEPFVIREDRALRGLGSAAQAAHIRTQPRSPAAPALHRLARKILGTTVGIALGGGAAFGLAHIGVLKVLEDSGIPIDLTVGTSFGSIIALGYGVGVPTSEMVTLAKRVATRWNTLSVLSDLTLTKPAFMTGDRLVKIFMPLAGSVENFDQLAFPCRVVAGDIETGERVSIGSGSIEVAGRASCAVPMLWCPVKHEGRVLVDGGVVDPVPAEVVREMGADICIAVNAVPRLKRGVQTVLSRWYRRLKRLDPLSYLAGSRDLPNMFDIIMNSMQTLQYELGNFKAISADVRINPDLSALTWIEFYKPEQLMACGAEAAERAVPEIKRVLAERLETPRATEESVAALTA
jgi:NTE family protein